METLVYSRQNPFPVLPRAASSGQQQSTVIAIIVDGIVSLSPQCGDERIIPDSR
jgi:hypothetical protein